MRKIMVVLMMFMSVALSAAEINVIRPNAVYYRTDSAITFCCDNVMYQYTINGNVYGIDNKLTYGPCTRRADYPGLDDEEIMQIRNDLINEAIDLVTKGESLIDALNEKFTYVWIADYEGKLIQLYEYGKETM